MNKQKNQRLLLYINALKTILTIFSTTFFTSFILNLSPDNILSKGCLNVAIFYLSQYFFYILVYFVISKFLNKLNRVRSFQIGIIVNGLLLILIILFKENISKLIFLAGLLIGCSDAFYYANYLVLKSDTVKYTNINNFNIKTSVVTNVINIVVPIILGFLIDISSFTYISNYIVFIVLIQLVLSAFLKPNLQIQKFRIKEFLKIIKEKEVYNKIKYTYWNAIFAGFKATYKTLIIILTIYAFNTNLSLGFLTSAFSIITTLLLLIFKKFENTKNMNRLLIYLLISITPIIFAIIFVFFESHWSLVLLNLFLTIAIQFSEYHSNCERDTIIKNLRLKEFIPEHQFMVELYMCICRIFSYLLFILVSLTYSSILFKILLMLMLLMNPIKFLFMNKQSVVRKELEISFRSTTEHHIETDSTT